MFSSRYPLGACSYTAGGLCCHQAVLFTQISVAATPIPRTTLVVELSSNDTKKKLLHFKILLIKVT